MFVSASAEVIGANSNAPNSARLKSKPINAAGSVKENVRVAHRTSPSLTDWHSKRRSRRFIPNRRIFNKKKKKCVIKVNYVKNM